MASNSRDYEGGFIDSAKNIIKIALLMMVTVAVLFVGFIISAFLVISSPIIKWIFKRNISTKAKTSETDNKGYVDVEYEIVEEKEERK